MTPLRSDKADVTKPRTGDRGFMPLGAFSDRLWEERGWGRSLSVVCKTENEPTGSPAHHNFARPRQSDSNAEGEAAHLADCTLICMLKIEKAKTPFIINEVWRRGWDSNPRYGYPYNGFRDRSG